ncbi:hypothetical protein HNQ57_001456 [Zhongshania antarctica]|jgi:hypothetical protein|uniref:Uncharacterized protein n=1 Tax=Zhongshania antarctica TaxID=641702 RepID=A0A840R338_9GAMM|nr:hypothetical protein [Zhongshania antarctica]
MEFEYLMVLGRYTYGGAARYADKLVFMLPTPSLVLEY